MAAVLNKATFARAFLEAFAASRLANRWTDRVTSVILVEGSFSTSVEKRRGREFDDDLAAEKRRRRGEECRMVIWTMEWSRSMADD